MVRGYRLASGLGRAARFPHGTLAPQLPLFRAAIPGFDGLFDGPVHRGTLNLAFPGRRVLVRAPALVVPAVRWSRRHHPETFLLDPCAIRVRGRTHRGLLYIPDPATKTRGIPTDRVVEVLTVRLPRLRYGLAVELRYDPAAIALPLRPRSGGSCRR